MGFIRIQFIIETQKIQNKCSRNKKQNLAVCFQSMSMLAILSTFQMIKCPTIIKYYYLIDCLLSPSCACFYQHCVWLCLSAGLWIESCLALMPLSLLCCRAFHQDRSPLSCQRQINTLPAVRSLLYAPCGTLPAVRSLVYARCCTLAAVRSLLQARCCTLALTMQLTAVRSLICALFLYASCCTLIAVWSLLCALWCTLPDVLSLLHARCCSIAAVRSLLYAPYYTLPVVCSLQCAPQLLYARCFTLLLYASCGELATVLSLMYALSCTLPPVHSLLCAGCFTLAAVRSLMYARCLTLAAVRSLMNTPFSMQSDSRSIWCTIGNIHTIVDVHLLTYSR